ncbi:hypothetical protein [Nodularia spumigena]|uniref:hypothetical protein n=1 Tax=Nodularia spumigena TaxID=70799 RepID=UPI001290456F|nr:hypothetical protein [Nodularia spumigena]MDB9316330.1 hypothetical protein [Nodularia spumigena CS-590/01A]MDB9320493.1 hypothetical protein [Nodularia spumigena CS-591/07A]MDB9325560.1 hypothetical protein [Nodularia spumigena CS-590/02]MDB9333143.1 hypothetical protein [Nodularia spumigena CS-591/04]MDB9333955.1 hypothetical protein [Nodularia spumigena CS-590/01]
MHICVCALLYRLTLMSAYLPSTRVGGILSSLRVRLEARNKSTGGSINCSALGGGSSDNIKLLFISYVALATVAIMS